jgi:serine/threonine protein kinase
MGVGLFSHHFQGSMMLSMPKKPKVFHGAFDSYTTVRHIGAGASGNVFEVSDQEGKQLALKVLSHASRSKLKRFRNEINFCFKPPSKRIIQILDFGNAGEESLFYVMPLYSGSLKERIELGIKPNEVLALFNRILDGVDAAHLHGVFHRDLKPANLLYAGPNDVVVADFGIAHFQESDLLTLVQTGGQERLGNFRYSAPEQRTPGATVDQRADIFALGLILNEMFTGHVPQGTRYPQIHSVAPEFGYLDDLVDSMIRQRPAERPPTIVRVKEELIGRGHQFVQLQHLEALKNQVVPESEVNDPIIADPIHAVEAEAYSNGTLTIRLNRAINLKWETCFRERATGFSTNFSAAMITFKGDRAYLQADEHHLPHALEYFRQYCQSANEEYAAQVVREHRQAIEQRRGELQRRIAEQEREAKILKGIRFRRENS